MVDSIGPAGAARAASRDGTGGTARRSLRCILPAIISRRQGRRVDGRVFQTSTSIAASHCGRCRDDDFRQHPWFSRHGDVPSRLPYAMGSQIVGCGVGLTSGSAKSPRRRVAIRVRSSCLAGAWRCRGRPRGAEPPRLAGLRTYRGPMFSQPSVDRRPGWTLPPCPTAGLPPSWPSSLMRTRI